VALSIQELRGLGLFAPDLSVVAGSALSYKALQAQADAKIADAKWHEQQARENRTNPANRDFFFAKADELYAEADAIAKRAQAAYDRERAAERARSDAVASVSKRVAAEGDVARAAADRGEAAKARAAVERMGALVARGNDDDVALFVETSTYVEAALRRAGTTTTTVVGRPRAGTTNATVVVPPSPERSEGDVMDAADAAAGYPTGPSLADKLAKLRGAPAARMGFVLPTFRSSSGLESAVELAKVAVPAVVVGGAVVWGLSKLVRWAAE
jgi:hypothetical protein